MLSAYPKDTKLLVWELKLGVLMVEQTFTENVQPGTDTKCFLSKFLTKGLFPYGRLQKCLVKAL